MPPGTGDDGGRARPSRPPAPGRLDGRHRDVPGVPPRGLGRRRLLRPAVRRRRARRRAHRVRRADASCSRSSAGAPRTSTSARAEALKYACNAFHATKVSFANEMAPDLPGPRRRRPRASWRSSARTTSSTSRRRYLRPGFAFGGSCLPEGPARPAAPGPDERRRRSRCSPGRRCTQRARRPRRGRPGRSPPTAGSVALLGLSFKIADRRPAREPERRARRALIGKGFEVRIYDPIVNPARLVGREPRLRRGEAAAPRAGCSRAHPQEALDGRGRRRRRVVRRRRASPRLRRRAARALILDLDGRLGADVEQLAGYAGRRVVTYGHRRRTTAATAAAAPGPHHRPEPAGPVRPAGLARVPGARRRRLRRHGRLPEGQGRPDVRGARRRRASTSTGRTRPEAARSGFVVEYAYSFLATARLALQVRGAAAGST